MHRISGGAGGTPQRPLYLEKSWAPHYMISIFEQGRVQDQELLVRLCNTEPQPVEASCQTYLKKEASVVKYGCMRGRTSKR